MRSRPLRVLIVGDWDHYPSELLFGLHQGFTLLGHWVGIVNVRQPIGVIAKRADEVHPDLIILHMALWSPAGPAHGRALLNLCAEWRTLGASVVLHDGDARPETRWPEDLSAAVDLVLCNHTVDRSAWKVRQLRWPYFAFVQRALAAPTEAYRCDLAFMGRLGGGLYAERTRLVETLQARLGDRFRRFIPGQTARHTLFRTPELAASAGAILGYGRPELPGWIDVRSFLVPGAGGVLLSDHPGEFLEPWAHYVPYERGNVESVVYALEVALDQGARIRRQAFRYVQAEHSAVVRVRQVLQEVGR